MAHMVGRVSLNKNLYSLYDIAKAENIRKEKIEDLMRTCYKRIKLTLKSDSASALKAFFNDTARYDAALNPFFTHSRLRPFAAAIRLETERCFNGKNQVYYAMFCVPKSVYEDWKNHGKEYNRNIIEKVNDYGIADNAITRKRVSLIYSEELKAFEKGLSENGTKLNDGIAYAIAEYMKNHADTFNVKQGLADEKFVRENQMSLIWAYIDKQVVSEVFKCIQRFNMLNAVPIKTSDFIEAALREKLDRVPIKYTAPDLYTEMIELEKKEKEVLQQMGVEPNEQSFNAEN